MELANAGLTVLARHMDIWTRPFVAPREDGLGAPSFARTILKLGAVNERVRNLGH